MANQFTSLAIELGQRLALHLELHLRILLKHLSVCLPEHLRHPLVGHATRTEPCGVRGAEIIEPEVGDSCPPAEGPSAMRSLNSVSVTGPVRGWEEPGTGAG